MKSRDDGIREDAHTRALLGTKSHSPPARPPPGNTRRSVGHRNSHDWNHYASSAKRTKYNQRDIALEQTDSVFTSTYHSEGSIAQRMLE
jgi:hypothetical protein